MLIVGTVGYWLLGFALLDALYQTVTTITTVGFREVGEFGTAENAPWLLAETLRELGAHFEQGPNWSTHVVKDGNLFTGQNPQSSAALAEVVIAALR